VQCLAIDLAGEVEIKGAIWIRHTAGGLRELLRCS